MCPRSSIARRTVRSASPADRPRGHLAAELGDVEPDLAHRLPVVLPVRPDDEVLHQRTPLGGGELADRVDDPALLAGTAVAVDQRSPLVFSPERDVLEELAVVIDVGEARGEGLGHADGLALRAAVHAVEGGPDLRSGRPDVEDARVQLLLVDRRQPAETVQNAGSGHGNLPGEIGRVTVRACLPVTGRRCPGGPSARSRTPQYDRQLPQ